MDKTFLEQIRNHILTNPLWRFQDVDRKWYCPFCGQATKVQIPSDNRMTLNTLKEIGQHVFNCPTAQKGQAETKELVEMQSIITVANRGKKKAPSLQEIVGSAFLKDSLWQMKDSDGFWYCPYCAKATSFKIPAGTLEKFTLPARSGIAERMVTHLKSCRAYQENKGLLMSPEAMERVIAQKEHRKGLINQVKAYLTSDEVWQVKDSKGRWVCPYCRSIINTVNIISQFLRVEVAPNRMADHLLQQCKSFVPGQPPIVLVKELQAVVKKSEVTAPGEAKPAILSEESLRKITEEFETLKSQVKTRQEIEQGLEEARKKQLKMLPRVPQLAGFEFECLYKPCQRIGGDFYDFIEVSDHELGMVIGDVSGHGIDAALVMGMVKKTLNLQAKTLSSARQTIIITNTEIYPELDRKTFITTFYGVLDVPSKILRFVRAGHNPVILYNPYRDPPITTLQPKGIPLGIKKDDLFNEHLEEKALTLISGDKLVLYTDGIIETTRADGKELGLDGLLEWVKKYGAHEAKYLLHMIDLSLTDFRGNKEQEDDVTLICVRVI